MRGAFLLVLCGAVAVGGCSSGSASPTSPTAVTLSTQVFAGRVVPGGFRYYSFTAVNGGTVTALLGSVTSARTGQPTGEALRVGIGVPAGTDCTVDTDDSREMRAALVSELVYYTNAATLCIRVSDPGALAEAVDFAVRFTHP